MGRAAIVGFSCVLLLLWMPAVMGATGLAPVDPGAAPPGVPVPAELSEPAWKFAMQAPGDERIGFTGGTGGPDGCVGVDALIFS